MKSRAIALEVADARRVTLAAMLAFVLLLAQALFAAHADDLSDHAPQTCEFCLSASIAADPNDLNVELSAPVESFDTARSPVAAEVVIAGALRAANPRGPPLL